MGQWMELATHDGSAVSAWWAQPDGQPRGAVVVLQEIFGVNAHIRAVTDRLAARGFFALAPALFDRVERAVELGYDPDALARGIALKAAVDALPGQPVLQDVQAAVQWLQQHCSSPVGVVGFCWGGTLAWRAASQVEGLAAAVCYYGGGMTVAPDSARQPRVPVMAHFGARDAHIPLEGVQQFSAAHPEVAVHVYEADHGFNCEQRGSYDETSAVQAKDRTLAFLDQHLKA